MSADPKKPLRDVRPACFDGMIWTINAITMLYEEQVIVIYSCEDSILMPLKICLLFFDKEVATIGNYIIL